MLPFDPSDRFVVHDLATSAAIGASSIEDILASLESPTCTDQAIAVGTYPAPTCATNVFR